jgi:toluene monooxygenase system ferredoxin subunit
MAFTRVCATGDLQPGQMDAFFIDGWEVLLVRDKHGDLHAMDGICPHEDFPLAEGTFDGSIITCAGHRWMFDGITGNGVNPPGCRLEQYAVKVEGDDVYIDREAQPA